MIERYSLPGMKNIWEEKNKYKIWLKIELLVCEALWKMGKMNQNIFQQIKKRAHYSLKRIEEWEKITKHDVLAFISSVGENLGEYSAYFHQGLTSSDILDTALALRLKESAEIIIEDMRNLLIILKEKALEYKYTLMVGRTHGVHAEPITLGWKIALWYSEMKRNLNRMERAKEEITYGKLSGAVGTFAHLEPEVEEYVCQKLGLFPALISSQIIQRDRYAYYLSVLAITASSLEKFATEIRSLQRTEIHELEEEFAKGQRGSSAMPHKKNPIICERICGLSRVVRANALVAMENVNLWNERDISHSSAERIILPDSNILIDYMLQKFTKLISNLKVYPEQMQRNLHLTKGLIYSQKILLELTRKGLDRDKAYQLVQKISLQVWQGIADFKNLLLQDPEILSHLSPTEIENCLDDNYYLRNLETIFDRLEIR
ncbi:MAG: adenylosuccinate lyase [Candidatus Caldatribacteriota bacterium]